MAVGGRIHGRNTNRSPVSLFALIRTIKESKRKPFPHCFAKLIMPANYAPIVLLGIVQANITAVTTELKVGFQFHLPYRTSGGDSSSLLVATGPNVSVNTIIGLPFITSLVLALVNTWILHKNNSI
jgi:hypothetical protein